jgi:hypothetical protein
VGVAPYAPPRRRARNRPIVLFLLALGAALTAAALLASWAQWQLLDSATFSDTSTKLLENGAVRSQLARYLVAEVNRGQIAGADRRRFQQAVEQALQTSSARRAWASATQDAHAQVVDLVHDPNAQTARLDLRRLVRVTARRVGIPANFVDAAPLGSYKVKILDSGQLRSARTAADSLQKAATLLLVLTALVLVAAVGLASNWRRTAIAGAAVAVAIGAAAVLIARAVVGTQVVHVLVPNGGQTRDAASAAWSISTSLLSTMAVVALVAAALVVVAAVIAGRVRGPHPAGV